MTSGDAAALCVALGLVYRIEYGSFRDFAVCCQLANFHLCFDLRAAFRVDEHVRRGHAFNPAVVEQNRSQRIDVWRQSR